MRHRFRPHQQHLLSVPRAAAESTEQPRSKPSPRRGNGRPAPLAFAAASAALAAAAVAAGVITGPTAPAMALAGHIRVLGDVTPTTMAGHHGAGPFLGSAAGGDAVPATASASQAHTSLHGAGTSAEPASPGSASAGAAQSGGSQSGAAGQTSPTPAASASPPAAAEQPITIYDSVQPGSIPAGVMVATYATGKYAVPAAQMTGRPTIWIDTWATDPAASVLDVEPGDATPTMAATWVAQKLTADPTARARIYTMLGEWSAVRSAIATLPSWMQAQVRYWIADPTGVPHMVSGASATQWYWGSSYDISTADPGF